MHSQPSFETASLSRDRHFVGLLFIADRMVAGSRTVKKQEVYEHVYNRTYEEIIEETPSLKHKSINKWFSDQGADAKRFAQTGLLNCSKHGTVRIDLPMERIRIQRAEPID